MNLTQKNNIKIRILSDCHQDPQVRRCTWSALYLDGRMYPKCCSSFTTRTNRALLLICLRKTSIFKVTIQKLLVQRYLNYES